MSVNANGPFIASQMADVIRNLMRAASSDNGPISKASEQMEFVQDLMARCEDGSTWWRIFSDAIEEIRSNLPDDKFDENYIHAAERGIKYFVESSANDPAAHSRSQKRLSEFKDSIRSIETAQVEARKTLSSAQQEASAEMDENAKNLGKLK